MKVFKKIVPIIAVLCCLFLTVPKYLYADSEYSKGSAAGSEIGNSILSEVGSGDGINQRMAVPMTSSNTKMKTFGPEDQTEEFGAQISAPSSDAFFVLFVQPGATGDLSAVEIRQDLNYDGNPDYAYALSFPVSGVCANGVISCSSGTWKDCHYFTWSTSSDGKVVLSEQSSMTNLAGCYCINSSCGSNLVWNNLDTVLKDMGGAAVASVQNNDQHLTITSVKTSDNAIYYYGQKTSMAGAASQGDQNYLSGSTLPEEYYGGNIPTDDEVFKQAQDTDSYYYLLANSSAAQNSSVSVYTCSINRNIILNHTTQQVSKSGQSTACMDHNLYGRIHDGGNGIIDFQWVGTSADGIQGWNCGGSSWTNVGSVDTSVEFMPGSEITLKSFSASINDGGGCSAGSASIVNFSNTEKIATCGAVGAQYPVLHWDYYVEAIHDDPELTIHNGCNPSSLCKLKEESVCDENGKNCVQTWKNFSPTGLTPLPYCKTLDTIGHTYTACMDGGTATIFKDSGNGQVLGSGGGVWWHIERVYQCEEDNEYDFDNLTQRVEHVGNTTQDNEGSMYYEDYDPETGTVEGHTTELPDSGDFDTCEKGCKVRQIVQDTQATISGTTADYRNSVSSYEDVYRKCNNGSCPISDGETILVDCSCINDFSKGVSLMQVMDNASHDMICSEE